MPKRGKKYLEVRGKVKKLKGRVKEAAGIVTNNPKLEREGSRQRTEGAVQESLGKARRKVGDLVVAKGTVKTDVNLGSGYAYKVLVEGASFQK